MFHLLSQHPKFEVEFLVDGSRPPHRHPNSIRKTSVLDSLEVLVDKPDKSTTFVRLPTRKESPTGREKSNQVDAINLIVDKVSENAQSGQDNTTTLQDIWLKIESATEIVGT